MINIIKKSIVFSLVFMLVACSSSSSDSLTGNGPDIEGNLLTGSGPSIDGDTKSDKDKAAADKTAADKKTKDKAAEDKAAADKAAADKAAADKAAADKAAADKAAADKAAADKAAADKAAANKAAADKAAADKAAADKADSDGDGVLDKEDAFPLDKSETVDTDSDGTGNNADTDDDNDNFSDADEKTCGSDPLDAKNVPADVDKDGRCDNGVDNYVIRNVDTTDDMYELGHLHTGASRNTGPTNADTIQIDTINELNVGTISHHTFRSNLHVKSDASASIMYNDANKLKELSIDSIASDTLATSSTDRGNVVDLNHSRHLASISTVPAEDGSVSQTNVLESNLLPIADGHGNSLTLTRAGVLTKTSVADTKKVRWTFDLRAALRANTGNDGLAVAAHYTPVISRQDNTAYILVPFIEDQKIHIVSVLLDPSCEQTKCTAKDLSIISTQTIDHRSPDLSNGAYVQSADSPVRLFLDGNSFYATLPVDESTKPKVVIGTVATNGDISSLSSFDMELGEEIIAVQSDQIVTLERNRQVATGTTCNNSDRIKLRKKDGSIQKNKSFAGSDLYTGDKPKLIEGGNATGLFNVVVLGTAVDKNGSIYVATLEREGCVTPQINTNDYFYKFIMTKKNSVRAARVVFYKYDSLDLTGTGRPTAFANKAVNSLFVPEAKHSDGVQIVFDHLKYGGNELKTSLTRPVIHNGVFVQPVGHGILRIN